MVDQINTPEGTKMVEQKETTSEGTKMVDQNKLVYEDKMSEGACKMHGRRYAWSDEE